MVADSGRPVRDARSLGELFPTFISRNKTMSSFSEAKDSNNIPRSRVACR